MASYEKGESTKGTITKLQMNVEKESKEGKPYTTHILSLKTEEGEDKKFFISLKSPAAKYMEKLKEGLNVTVKKGGQYNSVQAVFVNNGFFNKGDAFKSSSPTDTSSGYKYDPTGPIQGMVLSAACNLVANAPEPLPVGTKLEARIVSLATTILNAKSEVDKLVVAHLKANKSTEDSEPKPSKSKRYSEDEDSEDESPY